jgi:DNA-binding beta-propeller fold protein YncE
MRSFHPFTAAQAITSVVQVDANQFLVCDDVDVYRLTRGRSGYSISTVPRPVPDWHPDGLAYAFGTLYVADYVDHDVLKLRLVATGLELAGTIAGPDLRGPVNVAPQFDGSVAVADYDAGAVLQFDPGGALAWRVPLGRAHGVTASGGMIYATSLAGSTVTKLDGSGRAVRTAGGPGTSPGRYLLPAGLAAASGQILVTDAHTGRITLLDQDLHVVAFAGANGAGLDAFDYPYTTVALADGYLVADTYKQRLVRLDRSFAIQEQIALGPHVASARGQPLLTSTDALPYVYPALPGVDVLHELGLRPAVGYVGAYNGLARTDGEAATAQLTFSDPWFGDTYVTWAQKVGQYVVVGSPQRVQLEVIDPTTGMFTYVTVGWDGWWADGALLFADGQRRDLADAIQPATASFARAAALVAGGAPRMAAFDRALSGGRPRDWPADLASAGGRMFFRSGRGAAAASAYYDWVLQQPRVAVSEVLEVRYLSG